MRLKTLTYTSRSRLDLSDSELAAIHQSARHLNALDGISGMLLFDGARFLQIVEGSEDAVDNLVGRLRMDSRHSSFEIRDERFVERRSFADWSMELVRVSAGYRHATEEVEMLLPDSVTDAVRELVLRMTGQLAEA